jgi:hypothetical protein
MHPAFPFKAWRHLPAFDKFISRAITNKPRNVQPADYIHHLAITYAE